MYYLRSFIVPVFFFTLFANVVFAQCDDCGILLDEGVYIANDHRKVGGHIIGSLDYTDGSYSFFNDLNNTSSFSLGFTSTLIAGGFDTEGNLKLAANTYPDSNNRDFIPGPIPEDDNLAAEFGLFYLRVWKITSSDLNQLKNQFLQGNLSESNISKDILEWPAKGNPYLGNFAVDYDMAPFFDFDNDGIYNPLNGDFPIALVEDPDFIPFEFLFKVFNDFTLHKNSYGSPVKIEFHQLDFVVKDAQYDISDHSIFTRLTYKYKGDGLLTGFKIGVFDDTTIGCTSNDLVGVDTLLNSTYVYNRSGYDDHCYDFNDEKSVPDSLGVIRGKIFFNTSIESYMLPFVDGSATQGSPQVAHSYYNYLNSRWFDGSRLTYGETGFDNSSQEFVNVLFPDRPIFTAGWSMQQTPEVDSINDFRTFTTILSGDLTPGDTGTIDYADYLIYDGESKGFEIFDIFDEELDKLKGYHQSILDNSLTSNNNILIESEDLLTIFPNPAEETIMIKLDPSFNGLHNTSLELLNAQGIRIGMYNSIGQSHINLALHDLSSGIYYLRVHSYDEVVTGSFLKL